MSSISAHQNVGWLDRLCRGGMALLMITQGCKTHNTLGKLMLVGGGLLAFPSLTGHDPLKKQFGASTRIGDENNILNLLKQSKPNYGVLPALTQQASPGPAFDSDFTRGTVKELMRIG